MAEIRLDEIARRTGGTILRGNPSLVFRDFNIDSRLTTSGELFFAIVADRDGHDFVASAAARGAAGAVVSRDVSVPDPAFALIRVPDTLRALQRLAQDVLAERNPIVVGITGSIGKTTTKEFSAAILSRRYRVLKSEANFNNHLGLALSLLRLENGHQAAVLEMGMSAPGEIRALAAIAPPDIAVITNVSPVHLESLKTMENIAAAKKEILEGMKWGGSAVLNGDDPYVERISQDWSGPKIYFGLRTSCEIRVEGMERLGYDGFKFDLVYRREKRRIKFPFLADSFIYNLLAALGVAQALAIPFDDVEEAIRGLKPFAKRGTLLKFKNHTVLIDDSYNSNPKALEGALSNFALLPARRKVAILGDMLELGDAAGFFHVKAGGQAARAGWNVLITIGPLGRSMAESARAAGIRPEHVYVFATSEEAAAQVSAIIREGDLILVKGSRGMRTEKVVDKIKDILKET